MGTSLSPEPVISWAKIARTLAFWAVFVIGTIALVQFARERRRNYREISYNEFVQELEQRNIAAIQVTSRRVRGDLKTPARTASQSSSHFVTTLPFEPSDAWLATLMEKGLDVRGEEGQRKRSWPVSC